MDKNHGLILYQITRGREGLALNAIDFYCYRKSNNRSRVVFDQVTEDDPRFRFARSRRRVLEPRGAPEFNPSPPSVRQRELGGIPSTRLKANPGLFRLSGLISARVATNLTWSGAG